MSVISQRKSFLWVFLCVLAVLLASFGWSIWNARNEGGVNPLYTVPGSGPIRTYVGSVRKGSDLEEKSFCSDGYFLTADQGEYLVDQSTVLLLRYPGDVPPGLYGVEEFAGKKVTVTAMQPTDRIACEALTCTCEDYLLVDTISAR